ncbi:hypothetical protein PTSG_11000 [Salpingoeca rosetta]|uniref:Sugar phosphate transporter domain-containing protein n=1 Tax=Salpingoeca rosetta (strain ATCC 50818 / BSB-021) TaxID=946362 RepID=F2USE8_SALR5|nr:uncharacterized protein PTSG_11000 [Salpingoeca rosetta]EGD81057.1 hypothetical protein PTSG_11000 [Salpingoeca rosetta]|eukprot:XP_004987926.1 hypothetical protein PTSG_11000 [Salpingoeca rosetta]
MAGGHGRKGRNHTGGEDGGFEPLLLAETDIDQHVREMTNGAPHRRHHYGVDDVDGADGHDGGSGSVANIGDDFNTHDDDPLLDRQHTHVEPLTASGERVLLIRRMIVVVGLVLLWYVFSIGLTFYNKWLFKSYGLDTPLFVTFCHAMLTSCMAWSYRLYRRHVRGLQLPRVSFSDWFYSLSPAGVTSALDIGFSNMSLNLINVTLYTMVKSTVVVWLLLAAFVFKLEKPSRPLVVVIAMISGGLILFRLKEGITFHSVGFFLVLAASMMGGLRWVLTQLVLHKEKERLGLKHPVDTMAFVMPCIAVTLFPFALYFEGHELLATHLLFGAHAATSATLWWLLFGALLAFFLTLSEFLLVSNTSGLTLSVAGIIKEICTIVVAVMFTPDNKLTTLNVFGLAVSIAGIAYYNITKYRQEQHRIHASEHDTNTHTSAH